MEGFSNDRYIIWSAVAIHVEEKGAKIIQQAQDIKDVYLREVRPNEFRLTSRTGIILSDIFEPPEELKYEFSLKRLGEIIMLEGEKSVLDKLAYSMETPSVIFIDGPIVDPPTYTEKDYIKKRCDTIKLLLERKNIIIGCVKRIRERYLLDTLEGEVNKKVLESLPNDQHLILSIFTKERTITNEERPLATNVFRIGEDNKIYKMYEENGIKVYSFFYENDKKSPVLRFDIPVLSDEGNMEKIVKKNILPFIVKWSYPNLPSPLPVELAHQKCKLEKDSTEILYEEMITSKRILPREFQILFEKMRM
jgi:hypothetical protein